MSIYLSYLMGADDIRNDAIRDIGVDIQEAKPDGDRMLIIPEEHLSRYIDLIKAELSNGFWNEIVGEREIIFIFKFRDGHVETYRLSPQTEPKIAELCAAFSGDDPEKTENVYRYIAGNAFYRDFMDAHYRDMIAGSR